MKILLSLLLACCAQFMLSTAVWSDVKVQNFNIANGLPERFVRVIKKDSSGALWIGTNSGLSKYDGYKFDNGSSTFDKGKVLVKENITALHFINKQSLWVGTARNGLYHISDGRLINYKSDGINSHSVTSNSIRAIESRKNDIWIGTNKGLSYYNGKEFRTIDLGHNNKNNITDLVIVGNHLIIGTFAGVLKLDLSTQEISQLNLPTSDQVRKLFVDKDLVLASVGQKLFEVYTSDWSYKEIHPEISVYTILSIAKSGSDYWFGTWNHGLFRVNQQGIQQYKKNNISDNTIISLLFDETGVLWIGTFNKGIDKYSLSKYPFYKWNKTCPSIEHIRNIHVEHNREYFASKQGVFKKFGAQCKQFTNKDNYKLLNNNASSFLFIDNNEQYAAIGRHLVKLDTNNLTFEVLQELPTQIYFLEEFKGDILIGTASNGVYKYQRSPKVLKKIDVEGDYSNASFYKAQIVAKDKILFATKAGLLTLKGNQLVSASEFGINEKPINSIYSDDEYLYAGGNSEHIYKVNKKSLEREEITLSSEFLNIMAINSHHTDLWVSTSKGIFRIRKDNAIRNYHSNDGLSSDSYLLNSVYKYSDGKLFFGGRNGFDVFDPEDISDNLVPPKVALTKLTRFNEDVIPGEDYEGFGIERPIESLDELKVGHRDYVIGFEFAGLHFADPMRNQYQYKLEGFHEDWVFTDAKNRTATFTNLKPGDYVFRVKAANKDGIWSLEEGNVALKITVHPAPWLSWWAFTLYGFLIVGSILWFIRYRTQSAIARAAELEQEVSLRTKEIATQKNVIESLLERKNELFANISHEFRTPLTLILGPLEKELKALDSPKNPKHLQMIQRNATRLLGMVEQILKLTELKKEEFINKVPYSVNPALEAIVESFESLAESKSIDLDLQLDINANILVAKDALEVIVGNLVSNAIKYTPKGGKVSVTSKLLNRKNQISVTDTGVGMTQKQKEEVFERFVRLDKTSDIAGTGIGLSIVKELILSHDGEVAVDSLEGQGSTFTISLPTTEQAALNISQGALSSIGHLTAKTENSVSDDVESEFEATDSGRVTVLVIEDNKDMQEHIVSTLDEYQCMTADRGLEGLELAQERIPDLIICDVMMPGMDGYEVARRLRDDERTSHIPIVLLTAKGDKESRIQGWNENIDDYMTKPFDEHELKVRLSNILAIRNILGSKVGEIVVKEKEFLDKKGNLNKRDALFLERLKSEIEKNFGEQGYARSAMASSVALSERQFQRKLKALVNKTPMELLREYRLTKAAEFLKDGDQVGVVADKCGFSSISHFSISFKAFYEKTPKQYQSEAIS